LIFLSSSSGLTTQALIAALSWQKLSDLVTHWLRSKFRV